MNGPAAWGRSFNLLFPFSTIIFSVYVYFASCMHSAIRNCLVLEYVPPAWNLRRGTGHTCCFCGAVFQLTSMCAHVFRAKDWWSRMNVMYGRVKGSILDWPRFEKYGAQLNELGHDDMLQAYT